MDSSLEFHKKNAHLQVDRKLSVREAECKGREIRTVSLMLTSVLVINDLYPIPLILCSSVELAVTQD